MAALQVACDFHSFLISCVCLNTWGMNEEDVDALSSRLKAIVYGLFPQQTETPTSACAAATGGMRNSWLSGSWREAGSMPQFRYSQDEPHVCLVFCMKRTQSSSASSPKVAQM